MCAREWSVRWSIVLQLLLFMYKSLFVSCRMIECWECFSVQESRINVSRPTHSFQFLSHSRCARISVNTQTPCAVCAIYLFVVAASDRFIIASLQLLHCSVYYTTQSTVSKCPVLKPLIFGLLQSMLCNFVCVDFTGYLLLARESAVYSPAGEIRSKQKASLQSIECSAIRNGRKKIDSGAVGKRN